MSSSHSPSLASDAACIFRIFSRKHGHARAHTCTFKTCITPQPLHPRAPPPHPRPVPAQVVQVSPCPCLTTSVAKGMRLQRQGWVKYTSLRGPRARLHNPDPFHQAVFFLLRFAPPPISSRVGWAALYEWSSRRSRCERGADTETKGLALGQRATLSHLWAVQAVSLERGKTRKDGRGAGSAAICGAHDRRRERHEGPSAR